MTTASVYYGPTGEPDFVLIGDAQTPIVLDDGLMGGDYILRAVDQACRTLGWRTMPGAPIVRQFGGRGTVRVQPLLDPLPAPAPYLPDSVPAADPGPLDVPAAETLRTGTVYITVDDVARPTAVAVDGQVAHLDTARRLIVEGSTVPRAGAVADIDNALRHLGYRRVGLVTRVAGGTPGSPPSQWVTLAEPVDRSPIGDWSDQRTLVRMDDDTATLLARTADLLGIPADTLACTWIRRAAADAAERHDRFSDPGYRFSDPGYRLVRQERITGWLPDGTPELRG